MLKHGADFMNYFKPCSSEPDFEMRRTGKYKLKTDFAIRQLAEKAGITAILQHFFTFFFPVLLFLLLCGIILFILA